MDLRNSRKSFRKISAEFPKSSKLFNFYEVPRDIRKVTQNFQSSFPKISVENFLEDFMVIPEKLRTMSKFSRSFAQNFRAIPEGCRSVGGVFRKMQGISLKALNIISINHRKTSSKFQQNSAQTLGKFPENFSTVSRTSGILGVLRSSKNFKHAPPKLKKSIPWKAEKSSGITSKTSAKIFRKASR